MSLFSTLQNAGLPVIKATESGQIEMGEMTDNQQIIFSNIIFQYFQPVAYNAYQLSLVDRQSIQNAYFNMIVRLDQIQQATNPTNAQVIDAIQDMALYIERIMKVVKYLTM